MYINMSKENKHTFHHRRGTNRLNSIVSPGRDCCTGTRVSKHGRWIYSECKTWFNHTGRWSLVRSCRLRKNRSCMLWCWITNQPQYIKINQKDIKQDKPFLEAFWGYGWAALRFGRGGGTCALAPFFWTFKKYFCAWLLICQKSSSENNTNKKKTVYYFKFNPDQKHLHRANW